MRIAWVCHNYNDDETEEKKNWGSALERFFPAMNTKSLPAIQNPFQFKWLAHIKCETVAQNRHNISGYCCNIVFSQLSS